MNTVFTILMFAAGGALLGGALGSGDPAKFLGNGLRGVWDAWVRMFQAVKHAMRMPR